MYVLVHMLMKGVPGRILMDEMPPRGDLILPENLVVVGFKGGGAITAGGASQYQGFCRDETPP